MSNQNVAPQKQSMIRQAEYIYKIEAPDRVSVTIRHIYKTVGKECPNVNTEILHNISGYVDSITFKYRDSDGKSKDVNPIKDKEGKDVPFIINKDETQKTTTFGIPGLKTDLKENDVYWIEIEALLKDFVKTKGKLHKLPLRFTNKEIDKATFQIMVPFAPEGIFRHKQTVLQSWVPSPSTVYDANGYKVFQWNLGPRSAKEEDRFDVIYTVKTTYTPLVKYLASGIIGALIGFFISCGFQ